MIVVSDNLVISGEDAGGGTIDEDNPVIGWHNVVTPSSIVAGTEDPLYPASNLANPATNLVWIGADTTEQLLTVTPGDAEDLDYVGIARHNFADAEIPVSLETYDGASWTEQISPFMADDRPIMLRVTPGTFAGVRVRLGHGTAVPRAAVMYVGKLLVLQRRIYVGHTPMPYGYSVVATNGMSESGEFLGRIITSESAGTGFVLQNLTPSWYREKFEPFVRASRDTPFFFAWRPGTYPLEVGYGWTTNNPQPKNQRNNGMMQVEVQMGGLL